MSDHRVLLVTPYPPKKDGLASYGHDVAAALASRAEVTVVTQRSGSTPAPGPIPVEAALSAGPRSLLRFRAAVRRADPTVVHVQFTVPAWGIQTLWLLLAVAGLRRRRGVTVVWTLHEVVREVALLRGVGRLLYRAVDRVADRLVVLSRSSADCLVQRCGVRADRVVITPHGVPSRPASGTVRDRSGGPVVSFGYLHPDKGVEHLLTAVALARRVGFDGELVVAGAVRPRRGVFRLFERRDHRYVERLHALAGPGVRFAGYLGDEALDELLLGARVVVFPYTAVTQSGAINRALALGCPVIASDLPGLRDDVAHEAGVVPPADPEALSRAIVAVADDPTLRAEMAAASVAVAGERAHDRLAERLIETYRVRR